MKKHFISIALLLSLSLILFSQTADKAFETVQTEGGLVSGIKNETGDTHIFKGIPFAAPPVGDLRWKAPQSVAKWKGVKKCDTFGPSPMQNKPAPFSMWSQEFLIPEKPISEDCLYLNVWTAAKSINDRRPVLVWIYGGGFASGGSACPIYDGEAMAQKGVVFVSINYRVGVFGFFAHPDLTKESGNNASGNYGLMDQIAALQWVKKNIAAFGGDASNVTIAGQSAGSMSVNCLVASPLAKGLFQKAIAESGASFVASSLRSNNTLHDAEQEGMKMAQSVHANSIEELRKKPAEELLQKAQGFRGPIVDGYVLPEMIATIFEKSKENKIALLTGWNEDEGLIFGPIKNAADFQKQLIEQYGEDGKSFLQFYPAGDDSTAAVSQLKLSRDMIFGVQNYTWANVQSSHGSEVYVYRFKRKVPATGEYVKYGAFHTGEVPYAYNNLKFVNRPWQTVDYELANIMSSYWVNFAKTGNPNSKGLPEWPAYNVKKGMTMIFDKQSAAYTLPEKDALDFLYNKMKGK